MLTTLNRHAVLATLAGSLLVTSGCTSITGLFSPTTPVPSPGNMTTAGLIGNNSASLANSGLGAMGSGMTDVTVSRSSKLIGNNSASLIGNNAASLIGNNAASLIGNNSASLIGNNSASLIGNNAASYRVAVLSITQNDTGNFAGLQINIPLQGEYTAIAGDALDEDYSYSQLVRAQATTGDVTSFARSEDVLRSKVRALGHYVIDGVLHDQTSDPLFGTFVYRHEYTGSDGATRVLFLNRRTAPDGSATYESAVGTTSRGAKINLASTASINVGAQTLGFAQHGTLVTSDATYSVDTAITGSYGGSAVTTTGAFDLNSPTQKLHLAISQAAGAVTFTPTLTDAAGNPLATLVYQKDAALFQATYADGSVRYITAGPIISLMSIASDRSGQL